MQLAHLILTCAIVLFFLREGIKLTSMEILLLALAIYVVVREAIAISVGAPLRAEMNALYLLFSAAVFSIFRRQGQFLNASRVIYRGLFVAAAVALLGVIVGGYGRVDAEGGRAIGTFNNPNQLGYFAVCMFSLSTLLYIRREMPAKGLIFLVICSLFLAAASLSRAALVGVALGTLFIGFTLPGSRLRFFIGAALALFLLSVVTWSYQSGYLGDFEVARRIALIGSDSDDSLEARGYSLVGEMGVIELLVGFGSEGSRLMLGHEVHSTLGSYFVNYGAIGFLLFLAIHAIWLRRLWRAGRPIALVLVALPPLLYGLTHNGSRFTIYWVLLGLSFSLSSQAPKLSARGNGDE